MNSKSPPWFEGPLCPKSAATERHSARGFVVTLELMFALAVLTTVTFGAVLLVQGLLRAAIDQQSRSSIVIADARGMVIGKAVDVDPSGSPRVLVHDPGNGAPLLLSARQHGFVSPAAVFYSTDDCRGQGWLTQPDAGQAHSLRTNSQAGGRHFEALTGIAYGIGVGRVLFRQSSGSPRPLPALHSRFDSAAAIGRHCVPVDSQSPEKNPPLGWPALPVVALDDLYQPPFQILKPND